MAPKTPSPEAQLQLQQALWGNVREVVSSSPALQRFTTESCLRRYLMARQWDLPKATAMLRATLQWRHDTRPEEIRWRAVQHIGQPGRVEIMPVLDGEARPVLVMRMRAECLDAPVEDHIKYLLYNLEMASHRADQSGAGKMLWLLDMAGYSRKNSPPLKVSLQTLSILQNHYPERLGKAIVCRPSRVFSWLWTAVQPFLDPVTRAKVIFLTNPDHMKASLEGLFDMRYIDKSLGGQQMEGFDFIKYTGRMLQEEQLRRSWSLQSWTEDEETRSSGSLDSAASHSRQSTSTTISEDYLRL